MMDSYTLTVAQLKSILQQHNYLQLGEKLSWYCECSSTIQWEHGLRQAKQDDAVESEEKRQSDAVARRQEITRNTVCESDLRQKEHELMLKERELMQREIELLRRENEMLRSSPRSAVSTVSRTTMSIKNIGELLSEYHRLE